MLKLGQVVSGGTRRAVILQRLIRYRGMADESRMQRVSIQGWTGYLRRCSMSAENGVLRAGGKHRPWRRSMRAGSRIRRVKIESRAGYARRRTSRPRGKAHADGRPRDRRGVHNRRQAKCGTDYRLCLRRVRVRTHLHEAGKTKYCCTCCCHDLH